MTTVSDALIALARDNYRAYCYFAHGGRWKPSRAGSYICDEVQKFVCEKTCNAYDVLVLSLPPQHGKSMTVTETLPSWYLGKNPLHRVIEISYSEDFALLFGRRNKQKIEGYGGIFGISLAKNPNSNTEFELSNNIGGMISRGVMSGVTGRACNLMIIDDPIKNRREADSLLYRKRIYDEWENSFKTRLAAGAKVIIIQTRWHEDDLAGRIIKNEKNVRVINLPCEAELNDALGRAVGEALCPEIGKGDIWLKSFKESYLSISGSRAWNALFQGRPSILEGNIFNRKWWSFYKALPVEDIVLLSVDATFKGGEDNDYVALQVWGKSGGNIYLIDSVKEHLDFPDTLCEIRRLVGLHPSIKVILVEDKANGSAIIAMLKKEFSFVLGVNPLGGKEARANAIAGIIESGAVFLPENKEFVGDFIEECCTFPNGANDDQVDAMTQAINYLAFRNYKKPFADKKSFEDNFNVKNNRKNLGKGGKQVVI